MSVTSKKYFDDNFKEKIWNPLLKAVNGAKNKGHLIEILELALTQKEINLLEKRLAVLFLLKNKTSYREIAEIADVRYNMISFVKGGLKKKNRTPRKYSAMFSPKRKKEKIILPPYGRGRWKPYYDAVDKTRP